MEPILFDTYLTVGQQAFQRGDFVQAQEAFQAAVAEGEQSHLPVSSLALAYNNLAAALHRQGRLEQAIEVAERALRVYSEGGGLASHFAGEVGVGLVNLAQLYIAAGRLSEAEDSLLSADAKLKVAGDHGALTAQKECLAQLYLNQEKLPEAAQLYRELADLVEPGAADPSEEVARVHHVLSNILEALGRGEEAQVNRDKCLDRLRRLWWPDHPQALGEVLANVAESLAASGRAGAALPYLEEAAQVLAGDPPRVAPIQLLRLAMLRESGQAQQALDLGKELSGAFPEEDKLASEIGLCQFALGDFDEACLIFQEVVAGGLAQRDVAFRISGLYNLASAQHGRGVEGRGMDEAEGSYSLALSLAQEYLAPGHGLTARIVWNYSGLLEQRNQLEKAESLRRQFRAAL